MYNKNIVDLSTDTGFELLVSMVKEGSLSSLKQDVEIDMLLQKQAYADCDTFADMKNKMFSIATPTEAYISARYAEKCASELSEDVIERLNEACDVFNVPVTITKVATTKVAKEMFPEVEPEAMDKYAGATEYGTEFENAMAARAMTLPEHSEEYENLAKIAKELPPQQMINLLREVDSYTGADLPWIQSRVGSPEYAVFEKRASQFTVDLGKKSIPFEKLAQIQDALDDMGIDIDFDANDAYTTKLAIERLPVQIKNIIANMV